MTTETNVLLTRQDGLATITLARSAKLNALSPRMREEIGASLAQVAADDSVKVVLLRAEGRAFCSGGDLVDAPADALGWRERVKLAQAHHLAMARMNKPVIAAVQGAAVGGGAALALAADILVMADDARLVFPFVRLGLVPDGLSSALLQAKAGVGAALDVLLSGGSIDASEAQRLGLTRRVVPAAQLDETARALAAELLQLPWEGLMLTKALCAQHWAAGLQQVAAHESEAFALATTTAGHRQALAAVLARLNRQ